MPARLARPLLSLALAGGACLLAAAPAVAGPKRAAEAALASLDQVPFRAVVTNVMSVTSRGAGLSAGALRPFSSRMVAVQAVEPPGRQAVTFTAGPDGLRGVRVVTYGGQVYVSRQGGPVQRATGPLKRYLVGVAPTGVEGAGIVGAEALAPVERAGVRLRHLRVRFADAQSLALAEGGLVQTGMSRAMARAALRAVRFDRNTADIYLDARTGRMAEVTKRFAMSMNMREMARALSLPGAEELRGVIVFRGSTTMRVTALDSITVERPTAVGTVSGLDFLGLGPEPAPAAGGPVGNADGIALARRVNAAYREVPGLVRTTRSGADRTEVTLALSGGRDRAVRTLTVTGGRRSEWIGTRTATYVREPGGPCWTRTEPATFGEPVINLNGSRFYAPRVSGAIVRLPVLERAFGSDDTSYFVYTLDRRTGRVLALKTESSVIRYRTLTRAPLIAAPSPVCDPEG
jgi:hypothetical protein